MAEDGGKSSKADFVAARSFRCDFGRWHPCPALTAAQRTGPPLRKPGTTGALCSVSPDARVCAGQAAAVPCQTSTVRVAGQITPIRATPACRYTLAFCAGSGWVSLGDAILITRSGAPTKYDQRVGNAAGFAGGT